MATYYRPPVNPGWDDFGARIAGGALAGVQAIQDGRQRRTEQARYDAENARRATMDTRDAADRERRTSLENLELGVIGEDEAFTVTPTVSQARPTSPLAAFTGSGLTPEPVGPVSPAGGPMAALAGAREAMAGVQPHTDRTLRPGVLRAGDLFVDPSRSLAYQRAVAGRQAEAQAEQQAVQQKRTEYAEALRTAGGYTEPEIARLSLAAALGREVPPPVAEVLDVRRQEKTIDADAAIRVDNTRTANDVRVKRTPGAQSGRARGETPAQARTASRTQRADATRSASAAVDELILGRINSRHRGAAMSDTELAEILAQYPDADPAQVRARAQATYRSNTRGMSRPTITPPALGRTQPARQPAPQQPAAPQASPRIDGAVQRVIQGRQEGQEYTVGDFQRAGFTPQEIEEIRRRARGQR